MSAATKRVQCRVCGLTLSAVSLYALGQAVVDHENGAHGTQLVLTPEGDITVRN